MLLAAFMGLTASEPTSTNDRLVPLMSLSSSKSSLSQAALWYLIIGVFHGDRIIYREKFGYSDVLGKKRPTSNTIHGIGSPTKPFMAACLSKLFA